MFLLPATIENITMLEKAMPENTSRRLVRFLNAARAWLRFLRGVGSSPPSGSSRISSRRLALCQKNKYGEIVVPSMATRSAM